MSSMVLTMGSTINQLFKKLVKEIQSIKKYILGAYYPRSQYKKGDNGLYRFVNKHGDVLERNKGSANVLASFHYFGVESVMLDLALQLTGTDNTLLLHDGFYTKLPIEHSQLESAIRYQLRGLILSYKHSQPASLTTNLNGTFKSPNHLVK